MFVWKIPYITHNDLLPHICDDLPIEVQLYRRFIKFFHKVISSDNCLVRTCSFLALEGSCSPVCNSLNFIMSSYRLSKHNFFNHNLYQCLEKIGCLAVQSSDELKGTAILIRELCQARDGKLNTIMTRNEIVNSIEQLCVS